MKNLFIMTISLLIILSGCSFNEYTKKSEAVNQALHSDLTKTDQHILIEIHKNIKLANQLIQELNVFIKQYQADDELDGLIEVMSITVEEAEKMLKEVQSLQPEGESVRDLQFRFEKPLITFTNGIKLQLSGINEGNQEKMNEGYKQMKSSSEKLMKLKSNLEDHS